MGNDPKHHHHTPVCYLKQFGDATGRILAYRKDDPAKALPLQPENIGFQNYYYSQPLPGGGYDHKTLEQFFGILETQWPKLIEHARRRSINKDDLLVFFQFLALQRARVPALRDAIEKLDAERIKATLRFLDKQGKLPPKPERFPDLLDNVQVGIDPHRSIHAMPTVLNGTSQVLEGLGYAIVKNETSSALLTSDNPVVYFDPSISENEVRPYTVRPGGIIELLFPLAPDLLLVGHTQWRSYFEREGLIYMGVTHERDIRRANRFICRFGYEWIFAQNEGHERLIVKYADKSPVVRVRPLGPDSAVMLQYVFGKREKKTKW